MRLTEGDGSSSLSWDLRGVDWDCRSSIGSSLKSNEERAKNCGKPAIHSHGPCQSHESDGRHGSYNHIKKNQACLEQVKNDETKIRAIEKIIDTIYETCTIVTKKQIVSC